MSEDELELLQVQARKLTALDLKKQALAAKQDGRVEEALEFLKQAKKIEQEEDNNDEDNDDDEPSFSSTLPIFWKKVAVLCKQAGDLDRAKQALMHSKTLELCVQTETEESEIPMPEPTPAPPPSTPDPRDLPPPSYDNIGQFVPPPPPSYDNAVSKEEHQEIAVDEEEAAMLAELAGGGSRKSQERSSTTAAASSPVRATSGVDRNNNNNDDDDLADTLTSGGNANTLMTFTDEELMDGEMMTEFRLGGVEGIPAQDEYAAKVLAYKKLALKCKQEGDIPKATQNLRAAKQLEKVALVLQSMNDGSGLEINNSSSNNNNNEDPLVVGGMVMPLMNAEESELLGELFEQSSSSPASNEADSINGGSGAPKGDRLTVEDLEDMDDDNDVIEMVDMMGADALPTVEELTEKITEFKQNALRYKQEGNIELAKTNLLQSKKAKLQAMRLAEIYRKLEMRKSKGVDNNTDGDDNAVGENDHKPVSMEALEALMNGSEKPKNSTPAAPKQSLPTAPKDPWLLKPSSAIKAEVIRLKNEKQVKEATRMLQLFKQKLAQEQKQIELAKCSKMTDTIQKRIDVSDTQRTLWQYYHWFGTESAVGCGQHKEWTKFESDCRRAIQLINSEGSDSVQLDPRAQDAKNGNGSAVAKKLYILEDDILSLVETCTNANATAASDAADGATESANYLAMNALEVAVMGLFDMDKNEKVQKITSKQPKSKKAGVGYNCPDLRINAKLQLPIHLDDASKPVFMNFEPTNLSLSRRVSSSALEYKYDFDPSSKLCRQQIGLPRKDPKQERILLRRMETKTIQLSVYYLHNQQKREEAAAKKEAAAAAKKKSWFFSRGGSEPEPSEDEVGEGDPKDIFLGKVSIIKKLD